MTRKHFLSLVGALLAAPFCARVLARESCPNSYSTSLIWDRTTAYPVLIRGSTPKVGYLSIDMSHVRPGDWVPLIDSHAVPRSHAVQALNDVEGWYDCYVQGEYGGWMPVMVNGERVLRRIYGNVSVRYTGSDPSYAFFKDTTLNPLTGKRHS